MSWRKGGLLARLCLQNYRISGRDVTWCSRNLALLLLTFWTTWPHLTQDCVVCIVITDKSLQIRRPAPVFIPVQRNWKFLISNFRPILNVVCFLLGDSPASEIYMPTFRNSLFHLYRLVGVVILHISAYEDGTNCSETSAYKIQTPGNYPEESNNETENVLNLACELCLHLHLHHLPDNLIV
jgi:hypothetical protein